MNTEDIWTKIFPFSVWALLKGGLLITLALYVVFAVIVLRQIYMMTETLSSSFDWLLKIFAWAHFILGIVVFLFALIIL